MVHGGPIITTIQEVSIPAGAEDGDMLAQGDLDDGDLLRHVFISSLPCEVNVKSHKPVLPSLESLFILLQHKIHSRRFVGVHHLQMRVTIGSDVVYVVSNPS